MIAMRGAVCFVMLLAMALLSPVVAYATDFSGYAAPKLPPPAQLPMPMPITPDGNARPRPPLVVDDNPIPIPFSQDQIDKAQIPPPEQLRQWVWHDEPKPIALFEFYGPDGIQYSNLDLRGRPVLLNIWATWCLPCVVELPLLDALAADPANQNLLILPIAREFTTFERVDQMYQRLGIKHLQQAIDPEYSMRHAFGNTALPTTLLIDPQGREVGRVRGLYDWSSKDAAAIIQQAREMAE